MCVFRAIKALLRFASPEVIDLYGDNLYGEIDPYEKSMEILRTRYSYIIDVPQQPYYG